MTKDQFAALHDSADPLILFNIWDAGSARAVASTKAKAIATGSFSLAAAQGFDDGEELPFAALLETTRSISRAVDLPLSVDFEAGYGEALATVADNARALVDAGAIGCNLEDRGSAGAGLRDAEQQAERIAAADAPGLFVNARTDVFLGPLMAGEDPNRPELLEQAIARAAIYHKAGAGCFFAPGLSDPALIAELARAVALPLNIMRLDGMIPNRELGAIGVARISYGPAPWRQAMAGVAKSAQAALEG
ncbi:MAG: isocitrate lyase/phosphoenolpyruvate mutase family protein [Sphingomonadales bacterium]|nr:MAG: isocitrate lyase/phosphoenolpyruvate mutase family protein [Sphingomonadales bacterium]